MIPDLFTRIGLTHGEISIYLALLKLGETTTGPIGRESKVSKSKLYDILDKLITKGLVGYIIKNDTKYFAANDPKMILDFIDKKQEELTQLKTETTKILPELQLQQKTLGPKKTAEIYEGTHGVKALREELIRTLKKGDELLVFGAPRVANELWEAWFLDFHKRREARGVSMRILYNSNTREFGERRKQFKHTQVKYLPSSFSHPSWIDVYNDAVLFVIIPSGQPFAIVVRDPALAESFKSYFELLWKICKE